MKKTKLDCECGREPGKHTALSCGVPLPNERTENPNIRYCIRGDNSGHTYYIPVDRKADWYKWLELDEEDERSWDAPEYASRIDGRFTFTDPRCE